MELFDLIILGGGPAGYLAGERAGQAGFKTMVIEARALGGVCLNVGCIPSKTFLHSAKIFDCAAHGEKYGVTVTGAKLDHVKVVERKNKVVNTLVNGVKTKLKHANVSVENGYGEILGKSAEGFEIKVKDKKFTAKRLLIATGSASVIPPIPGVKEGIERGFILTNKEIFDIKEIPKILVVIGGGVIGLEMASYFNSAGSKVTVIEMLNKIAGNTDSELSDILRRNYDAKGVEFKLGCKVTGINGSDVMFEENGENKTITTDKVLLSIGRRAVIHGFGLEKIGVLTERGAINTDEFMRTNIPGVYAAGDVNGIMMLAHTAYREAEVAVNHMTGKKDRMRYNAVPSVIYTDPEVACIGETEESAKQKGFEVEVVNLTMKYSGRYVVENEDGNGIAKFVIDKRYRRILGAHLIGSYASEMIFGVGLMIETEMRIDDIKELVFPHPTVCEIIREGIFEFKG
jgi:dihydrolipoamide dehydrogenase